MSPGPYIGWIEIIGGAILLSGVAVLAHRRSVHRRLTDRAALQAKLDMLAAAVDPEYRKHD
jgi:hypothetical protein